MYAVSRWSAVPITADARLALVISAGVVGCFYMAAVGTFGLGPLAQHMALHIVLMNVVAPLLAVLCHGLAARAGPATLWSATGMQMVLLWASHLPAVHDAIAGSPTMVALAMAGLLLSATLFWSAVQSSARRSVWQAILALLVTGKLACLLGALLVFAPRDIYAAAGHVHGAGALTDQHLAGLLMLGACPLSYVLAGVILAGQMINRLAARPAERFIARTSGH